MSTPQHVAAFDTYVGDRSTGCLGPATRSFMENRLGRRLGRVRLLSGQFAEAVTAAMDAKAFACGETIVLGNGFRHDADRDIWLLAHELAHLIQQANGRESERPVDAEAVLERKAIEVADIVASGRSVPAGFDFGAAPYGIIQCHQDVKCPGARHNASEPAIWMAANAAIEQAYLEDPSRRNHSVFFGSDFDNSLLKIGPEGPRGVPNRRPWREGPAEVQLPKGVKEKRFGNLLLDQLRGLERQRRPDIIDFTDRVFYEIKSTGYEDRGQVQLHSYYKITEAILRQHGQNEPPWRLETAPPWYPKHVLPMLSPDPRIELVVCTEATDHTRYPGMILYEVRRLPRRRRQQRTNEARIVDFWNEYDMFRQAMEKDLQKGIPNFDPSSPEYVIIVPDEFFKIPIIRQFSNQIIEQRWDRYFRVDSEMARRRLTLDPRVKQFWLGVAVIVGGTALVMASVAAVAALPAAAGAGAGAGATVSAVAVETTSAVATTTTAGVQTVAIVPSTMVLPAAGATVGATATATAAEIGGMTIFNAATGSAAFKTMSAGLGVLLVMGTASTAEAATGNASNVNIKDLVAFRAVPVNDFIDRGGTLHASSIGAPPDNLYSDKEIKDKFQIGLPIVYDSKKHWIFGRLSAR
jgi:hypothetical protein